MEWSLQDDLPIYAQLVDQLKKAIISGEYESGMRLPSVRDLALSAGVNPNTMQRALASLEAEGMVYTLRTSGRFITDDKSIIHNAGIKLAKESTQKYIKVMKELGLKADEIQDLIKEEL